MFAPGFHKPSSQQTIILELILFALKKPAKCFLMLLIKNDDSRLANTDQ